MKNKIILIILIPFLLTGCYNYRELNDLAITSAIGIEKENDQIKLTIQVLDIEKNNDEKDKTPKYIIYESYGNTVQEAIRDVLNESSKRLFINHMNILLIDENLAKEGINDIIDYFFREPESRKQYYVLIAKSSIKDILSTETLLEKNNGKNIKERLLTNNKYLGTTKINTFATLIEDYINPNKDISLPSITYQEEKKDDNTNDKDEDAPSKRLFLTETAIFNNNKLVGYISDEDTKYLNIINNNIDNTIFTVEKDNENVTFEIIENKSKIKTKDNNININIKLKGSINDINYDIDLTNKNSIKELEQLLENNLESKITESIKQIYKKYNSDIYGFKDLIYKNDYNYYKKNDIDINKLNIDIKCDVELISKGNGDDNINEKD